MKLNEQLLERELVRLKKQEKSFLQKKSVKKDSKLNQFLEDKIPDKLQSTLDSAFAKAFSLVFEKGTGIIEKTYNREEIQNNYKIDVYSAEVKQNRSSLRNFSKKAKNTGTANLILSGTAGIGLGVLGVGLPDIVLFTGIMLKCVYQISLNYGFDYTSEDEKKFVLLIIKGALSFGEDFRIADKQINQYIASGKFTFSKDVKTMINETSAFLSGELLYSKFLQGIAIVGAVGGAFNAVYMKRIEQYAELKYRRRFYALQIKDNPKS